MLVKTDCRYFLGDRPCKFHKLEGVKCIDCSHYQATSERILVIKLGAAGDVLRTTPLLYPLKERHPQALIYWVTDFPELVPLEVDRILGLKARDLLILQNTPFSAIYNLDKDPEACSLATMLPAAHKSGFLLENGVCVPVGEPARQKWLTGLSDPLNQANTLSYMEEIFAICDFSYKKEPYILHPPHTGKFDGLKTGFPLIGLNTGCGRRWPTRLWPVSNWISLAENLQTRGANVLLLGGPEEHAQNLEIARQTGVPYPGHHPLQEFIEIVGICDLVVTGVTLALHLVLGLGKKLVLFNNIFNRHEFELYGLGEIIEPPLDCLGCFKGQCETNCMAMITPEVVLEAISRLLPHWEKKGRITDKPSLSTVESAEEQRD
jgi:heptosyltransferase-2